MGMFPYDTTVRRSTARVPALDVNSNESSVDADKTSKSSKLDMITKGTAAEMGGACYKTCGGSTLQHRHATKSASMRHKNRRTSIKRCNRARGIDQMDDSLIDDSYNSQTKCILSKISDWSFDVFALEQACNGRALFHVILRLFQEHNLIEHFDLDVVKLMTFATFVEEGYHGNPYHNATHAADVAQAMHCYITQGKIAKHMTPVEILISLLAAITHDLDHPGVNQGFLIATENYLATLYENKAVLEKHHWRTAIALLHQTELLDHLPKDERTKIEEEMKSLILATDMTRQQAFFDTLKTRVIDNSLDMTAYDDRHFILQIALKCADISNPCRHWSACKSWSEKVCEEFFRQGDVETDLNFKISPFCDRYSNSIPKIQTGFIDYCVKPLFVEFEKYLFPSSMLSGQLTNLIRNRKKWEEKIDAITSKPATRPTTLTIPLNVDTSVSDIPSPTESEEGDIPSPTAGSEQDAVCDTDFVDSNDVVSILVRRRSLPLLLQTKNLLTRRQSFPDGPSKPDHDDSSASVEFLDRLAEHLSHLSNNNACVKKNKLKLSNILENLLAKTFHSSSDNCQSSDSDVLLQS